MNDLYNKEFLKITTRIILDNVKDLDMWSVYNNDKYSEEIEALEKHIKHIIKDIETEEILF